MILLTGGAGYIGSHVNKRLTEKGYKTLVFDNLSKGHSDFLKWGTFILGDLACPEQIKLCFQHHAIESVMHFGGSINVGDSVFDPSSYYENNLVNTINLLNAMLKYNIKKFIFSSSCAIYGIPDEVPITEDHPQRPVSPYAKSKAMIEQILQDYDHAYGVKHINLRYFNAAGANPCGEIGERHNPETHLIPLAIQAALGKKDHLEIFGTDYPTHDGTCIRDYIHVDDLADAHIKALSHLSDSNSSDSFNLGNNKGYSVKDIISSVQEITGSTIKTIESPRREGDVPVLLGSNSKASSILNWIPRYSDIDNIVDTAWEWHRQDLNR